MRHQCHLPLGGMGGDAGFEKFLIMLTPVATQFSAAPFAVAQESQTSPSMRADAAKGLLQSNKIDAVFSPPRCAGCPVAAGRPCWSGAHYGGVRVHAFNVQCRQSGPAPHDVEFLQQFQCIAGVRPTHRTGIRRWSRWPVSAEIRARIKGLARNGGRSSGDVAQHVRDDRLVGWGWTRASMVSRRGAPRK